MQKNTLSLRRAPGCKGPNCDIGILVLVLFPNKGPQRDIGIFVGKVLFELQAHAIIPGTLLFLLSFLLLLLLKPLIGFGLFYLCLAIIFNGIIALLLLIDLIRKDSLESFFGLCIILANIPFAALYTYLILELPL